MQGPIAGQSIPVLFLDGGVLSLYGLAWTRKMMVVDNRSPMHLFKSLRAVGLIYDFFQICYQGRPLRQNELPALLHDFFEARAYGNRILGWNPAGRKAAGKDVKYASSFSKFCYENFGTYQLNPTEHKLLTDLNVCDQISYYSKMQNRKQWVILDHLTPHTDLGKGIITNYSFNPKPERSQNKKSSSYFPPSKVLKLIAATTNIRDKLAFILLFFGGLRESELVHLYVTDITVPIDEAAVRIGDPVRSIYRWEDPFRGVRKGQRLQFLSERYGLIPRNKLGLSNSLHAGWKGMAYSDKKNPFEAEFFWTSPVMGRYFAALHRIYLRDFRVGIVDSNPYYFVNFRDEAFGTPLKISNLTKSFYRAAKKIGLHPHDPGVNPHGARHFYGHFCASYLKLSIERTQKIMRHISLQSTQVYYSIDEAVIRDEIRKAYIKLSEEIPSFTTEELRLTEKGPY